MIQQIVVILIVTACVAWAAWQGWRLLRPKKSGGCAGGCGCGHETDIAKPAAAKSEPPLQMIRSDDLRARLKARSH